MKSSDAADTSLSGMHDRWPMIAAFVCIVALHWALPQTLTLGPTWLPAPLVLALLIPSRITDRMRLDNATKILGTVLSGMVTLFMLYAVVVLVHQTLNAKIQGKDMFISAAILWLCNVLVFAIWYWRLDAGGPHARQATPGHRQGAFFFPQMAMDEDTLKATDMVNWEPGFVDYLFLAFNTSTALSPADTGALSRWAKGLMMCQSLVSLSVVVLLAARAVNTLS